MKFSENEAHSANYRSKNEIFMRRCRHYKAKESKAESLDLNIRLLMRTNVFGVTSVLRFVLLKE